MAKYSIDSILSFQSLLNDEIVGNEALMRAIGEQLSAGRLVTIRRAFKDAFADRMFACLDECSKWGAYEDFSEDHFHYHHHNIYDKESGPADLRLCEKIFDNDATKGFVQRLSGRDCSGRVTLSASWYLPGDYSLPHSDRVGAGSSECRQVAFVWHLTKGWQSNWGGDLFWCPAGRYVAPTYNSLHLFNITVASLHFVTPVSPYARSKRLAVNGWWTGPDAAADRSADASGPIWLSADVDAV